MRLSAPMHWQGVGVSKYVALKAQGVRGRMRRTPQLGRSSRIRYEVLIPVKKRKLVGKRKVGHGKWA